MNKPPLPSRAMARVEQAGQIPVNQPQHTRNLPGFETFHALRLVFDAAALHFKTRSKAHPPTGSSANRLLKGWTLLPALHSVPPRASVVKIFLYPPYSFHYTAIVQFAHRSRGFLLRTQKPDRIMAGQNHRSRTVSPIMILSHHDSVSLVAGGRAV